MRPETIPVRSRCSPMRDDPAGAMPMSRVLVVRDLLMCVCYGPTGRGTRTACVGGGDALRRQIV
eukprot:5727915-Prymnesium_polylepis.1